MKIITRVQLPKAPLKVLLSCVNLIHKGIAAGLVIQIQLLIESISTQSNDIVFESVPVPLLPTVGNINEKFH